MRKREREPMMAFSPFEFISFDRSSALFLGDFDFLIKNFQRDMEAFESYSEVCEALFQTLFS